MHRPFLLVGLLGLTTLLVAIVMTAILPSSMPAMPPGFITPIIAFEFAQTPAELQRMFGQAGSAERAQLTAAMDAGNRLDFLFMLLYSGFLAALAMLLAHSQQAAWLYAAAALAALVLLGDVLETRCLLAITAVLADGPLTELLTQLEVYTWIKWGALALALALLGTGLLGSAKISAVICLLPLPLAIGAMLHRSLLNELLGLSVSIAFITLTIYALRRRGTA